MTDSPSKVTSKWADFTSNFSSSPKKTNHVIAYVHDLSAQGTSATSVTLQTAGGSQPALVYSPNKRKLLLEKQNTRSPVKISKFSRTPDGKKVIINEMATITTPHAEEYNFQYDELPAAPFLHVNEILDNFEEYREITVKGKLSGFGEIRRPKNLKLCSGHLCDDSGTIPIDVWENYIPQLENGHVYTISPVRMRSWQGIMKITTIKDKTKVKEILDSPELASLPEIDTDNSGVVRQKKFVEQIYSIDKIEKFLKCNKCFKKILQVNKFLAHCDSCGQRSHVLNCVKDVCVKVVIGDRSDGESLQLTAFAESLLSTIPDILQMDENDIADKLLMLEKFNLTYDVNSNIITELSVTAAASGTAV